jgi:CRP-like cAMP-binding protein
VLKLQNLMMKIEENFTSEHFNVILSFIKLMVMIFFIAHWMACGFFAVGSSELEKYPDCWIRNSGIIDYNKYDQYITSLYYAFTTMTTVGYGDLAPITPLERACSIFGMLIACMIFTYTIGSISHLVTKNGIHVAQYKQ